MTQTTTARDGLQALRAIAFLLVLVQHVVYYATAVKGLDYRPYLPIDFGQAGVILFFTISGYVMGSCLDQGPRFMWNRAARVYPPFWVAVLLSWLLLAGTGEWHVDLWSALLLPTVALNNDYNIPYWTLCYEVAFYALVYVFILCRLSREHIAMACVVWLVLIVATWAYKTGEPIRVHEPGWWILLSQDSIFFVLGLFVSTAGAGSLERWSGAQLALAGVLVWSIFQPQLAAMQVPAMAGGAVACVLVMLAAQRMRFPRALVAIGDMSYGGYLIHLVLVVAVVRHFIADLAQMRLAVVIVILLLVAALGGMAYGWLEYQLHNRVLKKLFRGKEKSLPVTSLA
ncbi:peptidoglycan/LPS O-acetylase OafA/YrhL [Cupriavidus alkaliphilus]|uniref:acyltransferase family protein n=1 Tax=Cupriavidus alkaliphilus TaxID=942866 RepID=UPI000DE6951F|nr:acyltransferase [Cupriavidus alkaliphilus]PVY81040.1 peptidoglycan/LPS O-acetylase OafA/YrhL [Cupriavidus alkaliphilus]